MTSLCSSIAHRLCGKRVQYETPRLTHERTPQIDTPRETPGIPGDFTQTVTQRAVRIAGVQQSVELSSAPRQEQNSSLSFAAAPTEDGDDEGQIPESKKPTTDRAGATQSPGFDDLPIGSDDVSGDTPEVPAEAARVVAEAPEDAAETPKLAPKKRKRAEKAEQEKSSVKKVKRYCCRELHDLGPIISAIGSVKASLKFMELRAVPSLKHKVKTVIFNPDLPYRYFKLVNAR